MGHVRGLRLGLGHLKLGTGFGTYFETLGHMNQRENDALIEFKSRTSETYVCEKLAQAKKKWDMCAREKT